MDLLTPLLAAQLLLALSPPPEGRWEGAVQIPEMEVPLIVDLARDPGGHWLGSAIVPGWGVKGAPLGDLKVTDATLGFTLKGVLGEPTLKGTLSDGTVRGEFHQGGNTAPFSLRRTGPAQVETRRESTPISQDLEGEWHGEAELLGNRQTAHLKLSNHPGAPATGDFEVVGRREHPLTIDLIEQEGAYLKVESHEASTGATFRFEGHLDKGAITGTLTEGPFDLPIVFRPGTAPRS